MSTPRNTRPAEWRYALALFLIARAINLLKRAPAHQQHADYSAALAKLINANLALGEAWHADHVDSGHQ